MISITVNMKLNNLGDSKTIYTHKGVFKGGGVQGVQTPPRNFQIFF